MSESKRILEDLKSKVTISKIYNSDIIENDDTEKFEEKIHCSNTDDIKNNHLSDIIENDDTEKLGEKIHCSGTDESKNSHLSDIIENNYAEKYEKLINSFDIIEDENIKKKINSTENKRELNWNLISLNKNIDEEFIEKYEKFVYWNNISMGRTFTMEFLEKYRKKIDWSYIWRGPNLSDDLVNQFHKYFITLNIPTRKLIKLKISTIHLIKDKINWYYVSQYRGLPKNFMKEFSGKLHWPYIREWSKFAKPEDLN